MPKSLNLLDAYFTIRSMLIFDVSAKVMHMGLTSIYLIMFFSVAEMPAELKFHMGHLLDETM